MDINLDDGRAAREEALGEPRAIIFGGERFELPLRAPIGMLEHLGRYFALEREEKRTRDRHAGAAAIDSLVSSARELLGLEGWERFKAAGATFEDTLALIAAAGKVYGVGEGVGESPASGSSSSDTSESSRPTSLASTDSTPASSSGEV
jgi:hypothetical protein